MESKGCQWVKSHIVRLTGSAGIFRPDRAQRTQYRRNPVQDFGDLFADPMHFPRATRTNRCLWFDHLLAAGQMFRQGSDVALGRDASSRAPSRRRWRRRLTARRRLHPPDRAQAAARQLSPAAPTAPRRSAPSMSRSSLATSRSPRRGRAPSRSAKPDHAGDFRDEASCGKATTNHLESRAKLGASSSLHRSFHRLWNDLGPFRKPLDEHGELRRRHAHAADA